MATIIIKEQTYLGGCPQEAIDEIKKKLTIANPAFNMKVDLGLSLWNTTSHLKFYIEDKNTGILKVPIGFTAEAIDIINEYDVISQMTDMRYSQSQKMGLEFTGTLRSYQQTAVDAMSTKTIGVLEAMTGSGKTIIACALIAKIQQPTLILVNTIDLAKQFRNKLLEFTNIKKVGFIGDGHFELGAVTVALLQSMSRLNQREYDALNSFFGMVVVDEVHIIPAETFSGVVNQLEAKYKFGLSATPKRTDGLTPVIFFTMGPKIHVINAEELKGVLTPVEYKHIDTDYTYPMIDTSEYTAMITDLSKNEARNKLVAFRIRQHQVQEGETLYANVEDWWNDIPTAITKIESLKSTVVLCTRKEQMYLLEKMIPKSQVLTSETPKKKREQMIKDFTDGKFSTIISSYQLFATGIDVPRLEVVAFAAPMRSEIITRQAAGRLMRIWTQPKNPIILDFVDNVPLLKGQAKARRRVIQSIKV